MRCCPATPPTRRRYGAFSSGSSGNTAWTAACRPRRCWPRCALPTLRCITWWARRRSRLTRLEKHLIAQPWQQARPGVQVKLLAQEGELYVLAQSRDRVAKERAIRRRQLKRLWTRLKQLSTMRLTREELLMKLGAARDQSRTAWRLVTIEVAAEDATFSYRLDRNKLRQTRLREGRYLLRTNLVEEDPAKLWSHYLLLMAVEEAFKNLKGDLAIRPVFHQFEARIEATSSLPSWLIACTSRWRGACTHWRRD